MDLTPPSMSSFSESPEQKYSKLSPDAQSTAFSLEASAASYPSPTLLDFTYKSSSPYISTAPTPVLESIEVDPSFSHVDCMAQVPWTAPEAMTPSTSAAIANILQAEYDPFANYQPCYSGSYPPHETYPPPSTATPNLSCSPPPSLDASSLRNSLSVGPRGSFSYVPEPTAAAVKMEESYNAALDSIQYPVTTSVQASYPPAPAYVVDSSSTPNWPKQELQPSPLYLTSNVQTPAPSHASRRRAATQATKSRRQTRQHTTKEEANFQCQVKGCGKFFSRSYNFKSHMETHDEKREYPFPCPIDGCSKRFVRKTDLQRHHQSVHMKERNHGCDYCGRLFARKDTLRRHMEDGCSRRFDIGTLDVRAEGFGVSPSGNRVARAGSTRAAPIPTALPRLASENVEPLLSQHDTVKS